MLLSTCGIRDLAQIDWGSIPSLNGLKRSIEFLVKNESTQIIVIILLKIRSVFLFQTVYGIRSPAAHFSISTLNKR